MKKTSGERLHEVGEIKKNLQHLLQIRTEKKIGKVKQASIKRGRNHSKKKFWDQWERLGFLTAGGGKDVGGIFGTKEGGYSPEHRWGKSTDREKRRVTHKGKVRNGNHVSKDRKKHIQES